MKKVVLSLCVLGLAAAWAFGSEEGILKPVAIEPRSVPSLGPNGGSLYGHQFGKPGEDAGTVNPHAVFTTLQTMFSPVSVAIDSRQADAAGPDVVRIDFTGQGKFQDAVVAELRQQGGPGSGSFEIVPTPTQVKRDDGTIPGAFRQVTLTVLTGLEGLCRFGDSVRKVRAIDMTGNLRISEIANMPFRRESLMGYPSGDVVVVADANGKFDPPAGIAYVGRNVFLDGKAWRITVSDDGTKITAEKVDVQTGQVKLAHGFSSGTLVSRNYIFQLPPQYGPKDAAKEEAATLTLPVDQYAFLSLSQSEMQGRSQLQLTGVNAPAVFAVEAGKTLDLAAGTPLTAAIEVQLAGRQATFSLKVADGIGNRVEMIIANGRQPEPVVEVLDEKGEVVHSGKMAYS
jgi:hypothetical protein